MSNALYPIWKRDLLKGLARTDLDAPDSPPTDGVFCALIDTGTYTYDAGHDNYNDLSGVVGTDQLITARTFSATAVFDGGDLTFPTVTGNSVEALVLYRKNPFGNTSWYLVMYQDTSVTGLPVTPNGGNITVTWDAAGIFLISDRQVKENIREVGKVGQLGVYEYNYVGRPALMKGFIAQEVERLVPEAVIHAAGVKAVNYGLAINHQLAA